MFFSLAPRVGPRVDSRVPPRERPRQHPRGLIFTCFQPFKDSPRKLPRDVPRRRPQKCPRKGPVNWSRFISIEFFRGRPRGGDNFTSPSKCSRPFTQSFKSTPSYLKSCHPRRVHPVKHRLTSVLFSPVLFL